MADLGTTTYTSVTWTNGDTITEAKLDNMVANDQAYDAHASEGLLLNNNKALAGKDSGGTNRNILKINTNDEVVGGFNFGGWVEVAEAVSFGSDDDPTYTVTISGDYTDKFSAGMRVRLTDSGTQYFIITKVAEAGGTTTLTLYGGSDYDLSGGSISGFYYSPFKAPVGFPLDPNKWMERVTNTSDNAQNNAVQNTWYNVGSISLDVPIGAWRVSYQTPAESYKSGTSGSAIRTTLSTANNTESDAEFTTHGNVSTAQLSTHRFREKHLTLTSKTTYYLNAMLPYMGGSGANIQLYGSHAPIVIEAVSAYL